jgi:hypothetical protein
MKNIIRRNIILTTIKRLTVDGIIKKNTTKTFNDPCQKYTTVTFYLREWYVCMYKYYVRL